jgi:hypothetical protein
MFEVECDRSGHMLSFVTVVPRNRRTGESRYSKVHRHLILRTVTGLCKGDGAFEHHYVRKKEENLGMVLRWRRRIVVRRPLEEVKEEVK